MSAARTCESLWVCDFCHDKGCWMCDPCEEPHCDGYHQKGHICECGCGQPCSEHAAFASVQRQVIADSEDLLKTALRYCVKCSYPIGYCICNNWCRTCRYYEQWCQCETFNGPVQPADLTLVESERAELLEEALRRAEWSVSSSLVRPRRGLIVPRDSKRQHKGPQWLWHGKCRTPRGRSLPRRRPGSA